eukprot:TRINITY_DN9916_c0_g1_i1.p2 TRINITY_DN9916_c0_g1~~TRINITY_DN9916_c0_g1_i1.p2  ORF type:complete len:150 (+),score=1.70 TRINITY_DN9916_c0_g1_i1:204-653(+)
MKRAAKIAGAVAFTLALLSVSGAVLIPRLSLEAMCENSVLADIPSSTGPFRVVVFERSCGATPGFSTQASLLRVGAQLPDTAGNIFIADTNHGQAPAGPGGGPEVSVSWSADSSVTLSHHSAARVFKAISGFDGVKIRVVPGIGRQNES